MESTTRDNRRALSMRLPIKELNVIDEYAQRNRVSKTDAFLHYLRRGIAADQGIDPQLAAMQKSLDTLLEIAKQTAPIPSIHEISSAVTKLAMQYPSIQKIYLFGSFARDDATATSDVDLRFEMADESTFSLFDLAHFSDALEKALGREIDIITAKTIKNKALEQAIRKEGILIYERKE